MSDLGVWEPYAAVHNLWVRERDGGSWRWQVNLEPCDASTWTYRRDGRVTRPRAALVSRSASALHTGWSQPQRFGCCSAG